MQRGSEFIRGMQKINDRRHTNDPDIILLDEPTVGVDINGRRKYGIY